MASSNNILLKKFGEKIRQYRTLAKLTQEQLSEMCDCSAQTISGIETGYSFPSFKVLFNISKVLNVPVAYFFNFEDNALLKDENLKIIADKLEKLNKKDKQLALKLINAILSEF